MISDEEYKQMQSAWAGEREAELRIKPASYVEIPHARGFVVTAARYNRDMMALARKLNQPVPVPDYERDIDLLKETIRNQENIIASLKVGVQIASERYVKAEESIKVGKGLMEALHSLRALGGNLEANMEETVRSMRRMIERLEANQEQQEKKRATRKR